MTAPPISVFRRENNIGYGLMELPVQRDALLRSVVECQPIAELVQQITQDMYPVLRVFAERAASLAVRSGDAALLRVGLLALALADLTSRDSLTIVPLFVDAAQRVGLEPRLLFGTVGNEFGGETRKSLEDFLRRDAVDRSLSSMGYEASGAGADFRYRRTW